jgi:Uma2 family endonuclease
MAQSLPQRLGDALLTLRDWADDDSAPGEYADGHRTDEEMPSIQHEAIASWLGAFFHAGLRGAGWVLGSETKYAVAADKGRKPDVSVFLRGAAPSRRENLVSVPPFIVVEVLSPSPRDQVRDRIEKFFEFAAFGVRFYWLVDPEVRIVTVYELGADGRYAVAIMATAGRHPAPGIEGLVLDLDALWAHVDALPE